MIPKRNEKDLEDVPADARSRVQFVFLERVEDAIRFAIGEFPETGARAAA
jgi:ATP-dependent Lon protease